jgi:hypothetical protein
MQRERGARGSKKKLELARAARRVEAYLGGMAQGDPRSRCCRPVVAPLHARVRSRSRRGGFRRGMPSRTRELPTQEPETEETGRSVGDVVPTGPAARGKRSQSAARGGRRWRPDSSPKAEPDAHAASDRDRRIPLRPGCAVGNPMRGDAAPDRPRAETPRRRPGKAPAASASTRRKAARARSPQASAASAQRAAGERSQQLVIRRCRRFAARARSPQASAASAQRGEAERSQQLVIRCCRRPAGERSQQLVIRCCRRPAGERSQQLAVRSCRRLVRARVARPLDRQAPHAVVRVAPRELA